MKCKFKATPKPPLPADKPVTTVMTYSVKKEERKYDLVDMFKSKYDLKEESGNGGSCIFKHAFTYKNKDNYYEYK